MNKVTCKKCGSSDVGRMLWGLVAMSEELMDEINQGKIHLGGCYISDEDPDFHCNDCAYEWQREDRESIF